MSKSSSQPHHYWIISVRNEDRSTDQVRQLMRTITDEHGGSSKNYPFQIPPLKVGTIDSLMSLSDDLAKQDLFVEQTTKKIERSYVDLYKSEAQSEAKDEKVEVQVPELKVGDRKRPLAVQCAVTALCSLSGFRCFNTLLVIELGCVAVSPSECSPVCTKLQMGSCPLPVQARHDEGHD